MVGELMMQTKPLLCLTVVLGLCLFPGPASAQQFSLLIKGGHVIDPKNQIDSVMDVAIADGKIARVAADIPSGQAKTVVDASGLFVTPGFVDMHTHVNPYSNIFPDAFTFRTCVTTVVDAGSHGWRDFPEFGEVIHESETRVLAFLNIVGLGMSGFFVEQNLGDMDPKRTAKMVKQFPEIIVGIKTAHYEGPGWDSVDRAVEAGRLADVPVMVDFGRFAPERPFRELVLERLRPGDIYTHTYNRAVPMLDAQGKVRSYFFEAQKRGVIFDVGHGQGSFQFRKAVPAMAQGFTPNSISTDLHQGSMNAGMKDMLNVLSKFLNMGLSMQDVTLRSTWNPAQYIKHTELGHLSVGAVADVAVVNLRQGHFGYVDVDGGKMPGTRKLECELTVREGQVVWDLNGASRPAWEAVAKLLEGVDLARQGRVAAAMAAYSKAQALDSRLAISPRLWRRLCWYGSLWGHANEVMTTCERAVELAPEQDSMKDSRGLARALTGDVEGAIADLEAFVAWTSNYEERVRCQHWIDTLRAGEDPFTPEVLETLRSPYGRFGPDYWHD